MSDLELNLDIDRAYELRSVTLESGSWPHCEYRLCDGAGSVVLTAIMRRFPMLPKFAIEDATGMEVARVRRKGPFSKSLVMRETGSSRDTELRLPLVWKAHTAKPFPIVSEDQRSTLRLSPSSTLRDSGGPVRNLIDSLLDNELVLLRDEQIIGVTGSTDHRPGGTASPATTSAVGPTWRQIRKRLTAGFARSPSQRENLLGRMELTASGSDLGPPLIFLVLLFRWHDYHRMRSVD